MSTSALQAAEAMGLPHSVIRHGPVRSLAEAARARGVAPADVIKTLVVRRGGKTPLIWPGDKEEPGDAGNGIPPRRLPGRPRRAPR